MEVPGTGSLQAVQSSVEVVEASTEVSMYFHGKKAIGRKTGRGGTRFVTTGKGNGSSTCLPRCAVVIEAKE